MDLISEYKNGKSIPDIVRETGVSQYKIRIVLKDAGVLRSRAEAIRVAASQGKIGQHLKGKKRVFSEEWKRNISSARKALFAGKSKGISMKPNGYVEYTTGPFKGRSVHVVAMEQQIGRRLYANEVVHHIDENRSNNDISNLMLMTRAEHAALHARENLKNRERNQHGKFK